MLFWLLLLLALAVAVAVVVTTTLGGANKAENNNALRLSPEFYLFIFRLDYSARARAAGRPAGGGSLAGWLAAATIAAADDDDDVDDYYFAGACTPAMLRNICGGCSCLIN